MQKRKGAPEDGGPERNREKNLPKTEPDGGFPAADPEGESDEVPGASRNHETDNPELGPATQDKRSRGAPERVGGHHSTAESTRGTMGEQGDGKDASRMASHLRGQPEQRRRWDAGLVQHTKGSEQVLPAKPSGVGQGRRHLRKKPTKKQVWLPGREPPKCRCRKLRI